MKVIIPIDQKMFNFFLDKNEPIELSTKWTLKGNLTEEIHYLETHIDDEKQWRKPLDQALAIFRLFKSGFVKINRVLKDDFEPINRLNYYHPWNDYMMKEGLRIHTADPLVVENKEMGSLKKHFQDWEEIDPFNHYSLRTFMNFHFVPRIFDKFINLAIAFDGLLFPDPDDYSDRYEFAKRLSSLLEPTHNEILHDECLKFYILRNMIVHNLVKVDMISKVDKNGNEFWPFTIEFENHLRKLFISLGKSHLDSPPLKNSTNWKNFEAGFNKCNCPSYNNKTMAKNKSSNIDTFLENTYKR